MRYQRTKPPANNMGVNPVIKWIWDQMSEKKITQEALAKKAGISAATIRNWGQGRSSPKLQDVQCVLTVLGAEIFVMQTKEIMV